MERDRHVILCLAIATLLGACSVSDQRTHEATYFESVSTRFAPVGVADHNPVRRMLTTKRRPSYMPSPAIEFQAEAAGFRPHLGLPSPIETVLPAKADAAFRITDSASALAISAKLVGAHDVSAELTPDALVYRAALGHVSDLILRPSVLGVEDYVLVRNDDAAPEPEHVDYDLTVDTAAGLRLVDDTLELLDTSGTPRLRVNRPYLTTARGRRLPATLTVEGCAVDRDPRPPWGRPTVSPGASVCHLRVSWTGADYPALLDPLWSSTTTMTAARESHTMNGLPSGRVLVSGGGLTDTTGATFVAIYQTTEIYDPPTNTWAVGAPMSTPRAEASSVSLGDGRVLVAGGYNLSVYLKSAEIYDPVAATWSPAPDMLEYRYGIARSMTLLPDGRAFIVGGANDSDACLATAEIYDPITPGWSAAQPMSIARCEPPAVALLSNGKVLVAGGINDASGFTFLSSSAAYNPATNTWTASGPMGASHVGGAAASLFDGRLLVAGGHASTSVLTASSETYDPSTGAFTLTPTSMSSARTDFAAETLSDGRVLACGGVANAVPTPTTVTTCDVFSTAAGWTTTDPMSVDREFATMLLLSTGQALVAGGFGFGTPPGTRQSAETYNAIAHPVSGWVSPNATVSPPAVQDTSLQTFKETSVASALTPGAAGCSADWPPCTTTVSVYNTYDWSSTAKRFGLGWAYLSNAFVNPGGAWTAQAASVWSAPSTTTNMLTDGSPFLEYFSDPTIVATGLPYQLAIVSLVASTQVVGGLPNVPDVGIVVSTDGGRSFAGSKPLVTDLQSGGSGPSGADQPAVAVDWMAPDVPGRSKPIYVWWRQPDLHSWLRVFHLDTAGNVTFDTPPRPAPLPPPGLGKGRLAVVRACAASPPVVFLIEGYAFGEKNAFNECPSSSATTEADWYSTYTPDDGLTWANWSPIVSDSFWQFCVGTTSTNHPRPDVAYSPQTGKLYVGLTRSNPNPAQRVGMEHALYSTQVTIPSICAAAYGGVAEWKPELTETAYTGNPVFDDFGMTVAFNAANNRLAMTWHTTAEDSPNNQSARVVQWVLHEAPDGSFTVVEPNGTFTYTSVALQRQLAVATGPNETIPWQMLDPTGEGPWGGYDGTAPDPFGPGFFTAWGDSRLNPNLTQVWGAVFTPDF